jgi:L-ascorbate metabolism protein UlaG (beta-lactamase superfamily)
VLALSGGAAWAEGTPAEVARTIRWYGQNSLRVELGGLVIRIDPAYGPVDEAADLILVTHDHGDHYNFDRVEALSGPKTAVLVGFDDPVYDRIRPGEKRHFGAVTVEAVPAYNVTTAHHPKGSAYCGFLLSVPGVCVYVTGDTERIPEMKQISCDIILLPLGQTYTFPSLADAENAVVDTKARVAIPVHYGMYEGSSLDADHFVSDMQARNVDAFRLPLTGE